MSCAAETVATVAAEWAASSAPVKNSPRILFDRGGSRGSSLGHAVAPQLEYRLGTPQKSSFVAFLLGVFLGPVGLWYKGHWGAGFAWLLMFFLTGIASLGVGFIICYVGMVIHATVAHTKD